MISRPLIGIDIGASSIKLVELSGASNKKLRAVGIELLPDGAVIDGIIQDVEPVEVALENLFKRLKINKFGRRAAVGIGTGLAEIKRVGFEPNLSDEDLKTTIEYEATQHFETDINELYYNHTRISSSPDHTGKIPVALVGVKREIVDQIIGVIHAVGLRVGVFDSNVFANYNMFEYNFGLAANFELIIDIGAISTDVIMVSRGQFLHKKTLMIGGDEYSRRIMENLDVDKNNAESLKLSAGSGDGASPSDINGILSDVNDLLVGEAQIVLDQFYQNPNCPGDIPGLEAIHLTGGGARSLGLNTAFSSQFQLPVSVVNPFHKIDIDAKKFPMENLLSQSNIFGVGVGLALRKMKDSK